MAQSVTDDSIIRPLSEKRLKRLLCFVRTSGLNILAHKKGTARTCVCHAPMHMGIMAYSVCAGYLCK